MTITLLVLWLIVGCATDEANGGLRGPDGTIAYAVEVESSEPGARIEVNNDYVGHTPLTITVYGDRDGTFHNFGSTGYIISAFPADSSNTNLYPQTKIFRTGGWFGQEDMVPKRVYFDMKQKNTGFSIDLPRY